MMCRKLPLFVIVLSALLLCATAYAQTPRDPGVRNGTVDAGNEFASVAANANQETFFQNGKDQFNEVESVPVANGNGGLGPRFNSNSCGSCHSQPATGGTSPSTTDFPFVGANPQAGFAGTAVAPNDQTPFFVLANGPVRESRFPFFFNANGTVNFNAPDGGVHDLFTISGRADSAGCVLAQPPFNAARAANNIIFRIPTPVFGAGLMQIITDKTLEDNAAAKANNNFGIGGTFNREGNAGTITRFGWKAQNKSLLIFSGEAYVVEMGITNENFQNERKNPGDPALPANCTQNISPENITNLDGTSAADVASDILDFTGFMQFLDQPTARPGGFTTATTTVSAASIARGASFFSAIGCATCHTPALTTPAASQTTSLSNATANLFSDLEIHHMGTGLADNVSQGGAGGDQFRSSPLWGVGQRIFFLHDGRTRDIQAAIFQHDSSGSEADQAVDNFEFNLNAGQQQDVLNFLRSL